ncbi:MAG: DUF1801 domain-containing protein [Pedobacter sp.]|jgi:hypothetical protein
MAKKPSSAEQVAVFIQSLDHPLMDVIKALREIISATDKHIEEEIKWNAPAFFYSGEMKPSDPKGYNKYIIVFNLFKKDSIRLVFPGGAKIKDTSGLLEGDYADGRRLAIFKGMDDVRLKESDLRKIIMRWLELIDN